WFGVQLRAAGELADEASVPRMPVELYLLIRLGTKAGLELRLGGTIEFGTAGVRDESLKRSIGASDELGLVGARAQDRAAEFGRRQQSVLSQRGRLRLAIDLRRDFDWLGYQSKL